MISAKFLLIVSSVSKIYLDVITCTQVSQINQVVLSTQPKVIQEIVLLSQFAVHYRELRDELRVFTFSRTEKSMSIITSLGYSDNLLLNWD